MATKQDMNQANGTYGGFVTLVKWGSITSAVLVLFVILLIA